MGKGLPGASLVACGLVAAVVIIGSGEVMYALPTLVALIAAVFAFMRKDLAGLVGGVVLVVAVLAAALLLPGNITFKGGDTIGSTQAVNVDGWAVGAIAGLAVPLVVAYTGWNDIQPSWMRFLGPVAAIIAMVVLWSGRASLGEYNAGTNYTTALLAIAAAVPSFMLLRSPE